MLSVNLLNKTDLVVEDDDRCWFLLREVIENANGKAIWSDSGLKAVTIIESKLKIDLVLMDIQLPVQNGLVTTQIIKKLQPDLPVIAQTAYSESEFLQKILQAGCTDYVLKPYDFEVMSEIIKKALFMGA